MATDKQILEHCLNRYKRTKGYECNIKNPKRYTEKIQWKKLHDRRPLLTKTADKYGVYDYLKKVKSPVMPPKLLAVVDKPIIPEGLPEKWIAKATHGSSWNIIYDKKDKAVELFKKWLSEKYSPISGEWGYKNIKPRIVFQEYFEIIRDYKFYVFNGKVKFITQVEFPLGLLPHEVTWTEYVSQTQMATYDRDWNYLGIMYVYNPGNPKPKPKEFRDMRDIAEVLGKPFDFVRVDFLVANDRIYFGEFTHYPTSGFQVIKPDSYDLKLGKLWKLPQL